MKNRSILAVLLALCLVLTVAITAAAAEEVIATGTVSSSIGTLNVRSGPGTNYAKVGMLYNGDRVEIYEIKSTVGYGWGRIDIGWISLEYVELDPEPTDPPDDGYDLVLATGIVEGNSELNAYENPDPDSTIIYTYSPESVLKFYDFRTAGGSEWGKTECGGWVDMACVTLYDDPIDLSTIAVKGKKDGVAWILYTDGTLAITGDCSTKSMDDKWPAPWKPYAGQINAIRIEPGSINYFSGSNFQDLTNVNTVYVSACPFTVQGLFRGCTSFTAYDVLDPDTARFAALDGLLLDKQDPQTLVSCPTGIDGVLELPDSITVIGDYAFQYCEQLEEVILPDGLDTVDDYAFNGCSSLKAVTFPASTRFLGLELFDGCASLKTIYFEGDAPDTYAPGTAIGCTFGAYEESRNPKDTRITATAYYPADNPTWTQEAMEALGGNITWVPLGTDGEPAFTEGVIAVGAVNSSIGTLNVRSGPGTDYGKVATLSNGDRVEVYETRTVSGAKWGRIDIGWISMAYVKLDAAQPDYSPIVASGDMNGHGLWWKFCEDGKLFLIGKSGVRAQLDYYSADRYPWYKYKDRITDVIVTGNSAYISAYSFDNYPNLDRVVLCDTVEEIDPRAFSNCPKLESITIPDSLTKIGQHAFLNCTALKEIIISSDAALETIEEKAFSNTGLTGLSLPGSLRCIKASAFEDCAALASLTLGDGLLEIGHKAFAGCGALTGDLYLSETIESIYSDSFDTCPGFTSVTMNNTHARVLKFAGSTVLKSVTLDGQMTDTGSSLFENCTALSEVTINSPLELIGNYTFGGCTALTQITLPDTLETIANSAFRGSGLTSIEIPASVTSLDWRSFGDCADLEEVTFVGDVPSINSAAFSGVTATAYYPGDNDTWTEDVMQNYGGTLTWKVLGGQVEEIAGGICGDEGENLFWSLSEDGTLTISGEGAMQDFTFPGRYSGAPWYPYRSQILRVQVESGVTTIGKYAFHSLSNVTDVRLPEGLLRIGTSAFSQSSGITSITLPETLEEICPAAFNGMGGLTEITIPAATTTIGEEAFAHNGSLKAIRVAADNPNYSSDSHGVLFNKAKTELIVCPGGFEGAYTVPEGVTLLHNKAFSLCEGLTAVDFPASLETIENFAFFGCYGLTRINFQGGAPEIGPEAFFDVTADVTYPGGNSTWTDEVMLDYGGCLTWVAQKPAVIYGDGNGDGEVNGLDVIVLRQYIAEWNVAIDLEAADANGDSRVDSLDLILLRQYVAGWDVTLGG